MSPANPTKVVHGLILLEGGRTSLEALPEEPSQSLFRLAMTGQFSAIFFAAMRAMRDNADIATLVRTFRMALHEPKKLLGRDACLDENLHGFGVSVLLAFTDRQARFACEQAKMARNRIEMIVIGE